MKLFPNLGNKTNYILHFRNLQLYFWKWKWFKNVRLVNNEKEYTSRPTHITHKIFGKNYAALHEVKPVLTFHKPRYVGFTVLELSKWLIHNFHYNFVDELLFTDTDSLTDEVKSEDVCK